MKVNIILKRNYLTFISNEMPIPLNQFKQYLEHHKLTIECLIPQLNSGIFTQNQLETIIPNALG